VITKVDLVQVEEVLGVAMKEVVVVAVEVKVDLVGPRANVATTEESPSVTLTGNKLSSGNNARRASLMSVSLHLMGKPPPTTVFEKKYLDLMAMSRVTKASILTSVCSCNDSLESFSSLKILKPQVWENPRSKLRFNSRRSKSSISCIASPPAQSLFSSSVFGLGTTSP
jgi:hypothetical protein